MFRTNLNTYYGFAIEIAFTFAIVFAFVCHWAAILIIIRKWLQLVAVWALLFPIQFRLPCANECVCVCAQHLHIYKIIFWLKNWLCNYVGIAHEFDLVANRCINTLDYYSENQSNQRNNRIRRYYLIWCGSFVECCSFSTRHIHTIPFTVFMSIEKCIPSVRDFRALKINHKWIVTSLQQKQKLCNNPNFNILSTNEALLLLILNSGFRANP